MVHRKTVGLGLTGLSMVFLSILFILPWVKIFFPVVSGFMNVDTAIEKARLAEKEAKKAAAEAAKAEMRFASQQKREAEAEQRAAAAKAEAEMRFAEQRAVNAVNARERGGNEMEDLSQEELEEISIEIKDIVYQRARHICSLINQ